MSSLQAVLILIIQKSMSISTQTTLPKQFTTNSINPNLTQIFEK